MGGRHPLVVDMVASLDRYLTHGSAGCLEITMISWPPQFAPHGALLPPSDSDLTTCRTTLISTSLTTNPTSRPSNFCCLPQLPSPVVVPTPRP